MSKLFPNSSITHRKITLTGTSLTKGWTAPQINIKAKVVCGKCNSGWMSRLENDLAKPAMEDLILGNRIGQLSNKRARGLSLFAFKTAVVANRSLPTSEWFFDRSDRFTFRESLTIAPNVSMYLVGMANSLHGVVFSHNVTYPDLSLNVCSFCVGHLGFQVVSAKYVKIITHSFQSIPTPPGLVTRLYPGLDQISWPPKRVLGTQAFNDFAVRWNSIKSL